ncbi:unnamed protein product, partial [Hapterophycus canaliculatus]
QEKLVAELKKRREKAAKQLKEARAAQKDAERRCRLLEEEKEAICDDYEGRLQQQAANYEAQLMAPLPGGDEYGVATAGDGGTIAPSRPTPALSSAGTAPAAEGEVERLRALAEDLEMRRKVSARKLREVMRTSSEKEERFLIALEKEKSKADRHEEMLEDSRKERDAECERLQKNIDSLQEQLDVKAATVRHLWEKVAAIRRVKATGNEDLK